MINKFISEYILIEQVVFVLIVKNLIKNEKFYFASNLYEKNVKIGNFSFRKDLQISSHLFFHKSYTFSFIHQKRFHEKQIFNFLPQNIRETEKILRNKIVYFKKSTVLVMNIFL